MRGRHPFWWFTCLLGTAGMQSLQAVEASSLQAQIDAAESGAILEIDAGEYSGNLVIDKPISLMGQGKVVIEGDRSGHVIHVNSPGVSISGLTIRGSGNRLSEDHSGVFVTADHTTLDQNEVEDSLHGIYLKRASNCVISNNAIRGKTTKWVPIEDVVSQGMQLPNEAGLCAVPLNVNQRGNGIHLWNSSENTLVGNRVSHTRDGIYFSFSDRTTVRENHVEQVRYGLHYMYSDNNIFENNRFTQNAAGAAIMYSKGLFVKGNAFVANRGHRAYGLLVQSVDDTTFFENQTARNTVGIYLENSNRNRFLQNRVGQNYIGIRLTASSSDNRFSRNRIGANLHSVESGSDSSGNDWSVDGRGNHWQTSQLVDLDRDGIAEMPHYQTDVIGEQRRAFPLVALLSESPILKILEYVQQRTPMDGIPAIMDPHPLISTSRKESHD